MLERDAGMPEWTTEPTAKALYGGAELLGETAVNSLTFARRAPASHDATDVPDPRPVLHGKTETVGSVQGVLVTATLTNEPHVTVRRRAGTGSPLSGRRAGVEAARRVDRRHRRRHRTCQARPPRSPDQVTKAEIAPLAGSAAVAAEMGRRVGGRS